MTLSLALQAAAVYALALLLGRLGPPGRRRSVLITASLVVAGLPLMGLVPSWSVEVPAGAVALLDGVGVVQEPASAASAALPSPAPARPVPVWPILWGLGFVVALGRLAADLLAVHRLRASARDRRGDVATSDRVEVPLVVGVLRPLVLLPAAAGRWPAERRALAIAHERAHVHHRDNLWVLLARLVACVHWFDPLAWRALRSLRDACEHHADDAVLSRGANPTSYADTLLAVARERAPALGLAMARRSGLERRVRAVLAPRRPASVAGRALGVAVVVVTGLITATCSSPSQVAGAPEPAAAPAPAPTAWSDVLEAEADRVMREHAPEGVALVVLDAHTGAPLGQADRGGLLDRAVSPGSILKPFLVVAALESGTPTDHTFDDGDMASIMERSSNDGARQIATHVGREPLESVFGRVGLALPAGVSLERIAVADGVLVSPRQVAAAWVHLAGHGAIPTPIAATTREMLERVVTGEQGTGRQAAIPGVRVAGKTGTAPWVGADGEVVPKTYLASFVGLVPAVDPELVVLVSVAAPKSEPSWGGVVAAPVFQRIARHR